MVHLCLLNSISSSRDTVLEGTLQAGCSFGELTKDLKILKIGSGLDSPHDMDYSMFGVAQYVN